MIKEETKSAIREKPLEYRQAMVRFIQSTMGADDFAGAFWDDVNERWLDEADAIAEAFEAKIPEPEFNVIEDDDIALLHDAICEGRRQDAIDVLNSIAGERLRSVSEQHNLFPSRVPA